jgi:hypothetical protein
MALDNYYKRMMFWTGIALAASIAVALVVVEIVMRVYGP